MARDGERIEREQRAERLVWARSKAGYRGPTSVARELNMSVNSYKAHEQGRNGFGLGEAKRYAKLFGVSLGWLNFGLGEPDDDDSQVGTTVPVPLISWISAGALLQPDTPLDIEDVPIILEPDLDPNGDWIALRVDGDSMNRVSPHNSIIFVNRKERRLVPGAYYVIGDGDGGATYKRFRPPNTFEPNSTNSEHSAFVLPVGQDPDIIGRVRKSVLRF